MAEYIVERIYAENMQQVAYRESIVRCRDCKSWAGPCCDDHEQGTCSGWSTASGTVLIVTNANDFCAWGKRRSE